MELKKKIDENVVVSANYLDNPAGMCMRIRRKGDNYYNTVARIRMTEDGPQLTILQDVAERYGIKIVHKQSNITEW